MTTARTTRATAATPTALSPRPSRIPLDAPRSLYGKAMVWWCRRAYGEVLDPGLALLHSPKVVRAMMAHERRVAGYRALDRDLRGVVQLATAASVGCGWCLDFGYWAAHHEGVPVAKLRAVTGWRDSALFTELERRAMAYAEAMTATPVAVTDEMVAALRELLTDEQLVELTALVAVENTRARTNAALGLESQGFRAQCDLADAP